MRLLGRIDVAGAPNGLACAIAARPIGAAQPRIGQPREGAEHDQVGGENGRQRGQRARAAGRVRHARWRSHHHSASSAAASSDASASSSQRGREVDGVARPALSAPARSHDADARSRRSRSRLSLGRIGLRPAQRIIHSPIGSTRYRCVVERLAAAGFSQRLHAGPRHAQHLHRHGAGHRLLQRRAAAARRRSPARSCRCGRVRAPASRATGAARTAAVRTPRRRPMGRPRSAATALERTQRHAAALQVDAGRVGQADGGLDQLAIGGIAAGGPHHVTRRGSCAITGAAHTSRISAICSRPDQVRRVRSSTTAIGSECTVIARGSASLSTSRSNQAVPNGEPGDQRAEREPLQRIAVVLPHVLRRHGPLAHQRVAPIGAIELQQRQRPASATPASRANCVCIEILPYRPGLCRCARAPGGATAMERCALRCAPRPRPCRARAGACDPARRAAPSRAAPARHRPAPAAAASR